MVYVAAALLSNAPLMFLVLFLSFFERSLLLENLLLFQIVFFAVMFGGTALSSFLVVRRFVQRPEALGLATGSLGFAIYFVYTIVFYRDYMMLGGFWPIVAFMLGGLSGAQLNRLL